MKFLIFHYIPGAGGKFLINCLAYSGQVAVQNAQHARVYVQTMDLEYLDSVMLGTIPSIAQSRDWWKHELGCEGLFSAEFLLSSGRRDRDCLQSISDLIDRNLWLPIISHSRDMLDGYLKLSADHERFVVYVDSDPVFIDLCIRAKWPEAHHCLDIDQYQAFQIETDSVLDRFDHTVKNWHAVNDNIDEILRDLSGAMGIEFDVELAHRYIDQYRDFHQQKLTTLGPLGLPGRLLPVQSDSLPRSAK